MDIKTGAEISNKLYRAVRLKALNSATDNAATCNRNDAIMLH